MADPKEEKKEKDPNNKITGWDVLDTPQLLRKLPVGPSVEELQDSKVGQLLENKSRPTSHTLKDVLAFTLGNALQEAVGAGIGAGINKVKGTRAISKRMDDILKNAAETAKTSKAIDIAGRKTDDVTNDIIKNIDNAYNDARKADYRLKHADSEKDELSRRLANKQKSIDVNKKEIEKNNKSLKKVADASREDVIDLDIDHRGIDSLSSDEYNIYKKYNDKFDLEEKNKTLKRHIREDEAESSKLLDEINNYPKTEELQKKVDDAVELIKSHKNMLEDYIKGMSKEDLAKKYGNAKQTYVDHPHTKSVKTAGQKVWTLSDKDSLFLNWLDAMGDDPRGLNFLKEINENTDTNLLEMFLMAKSEELDKISSSNSKEAIKKAANSILDDWETLSKAQKRNIADRTRFASNFESDNLKMKAENEANKSLEEVAKKGGKQLLGNDVFGLKLKEPAARQSILSKLKKEKSYIDTFNSMISASDPLYKSLQAVDGSNSYRQSLDPLIKKGMSVSEAIQDRALERVIDYYDKGVNEYFSQLLSHDVSPSTLEGMHIKPDFSNSKIRNADGTLKNTEELAKFLTKDPIYIDTIDEYIKGLTNNANTFAKAGALKGAAIPLLGRYAERAIKSHVVNNYDPFGKDPKVKLPPNMRPWDSSTEFSVADKLLDNTKNFFGINFDLDPSRYSTKQLNDLRQAIANANEEVGKWNPIEIEGWSDREVLRLIKEIGEGKRPDISAKVKAEYKKLKEEN